MRRLACRVLGVLFVGIMSLLLLAGPASAHAELLSSSPADGATLDRAPTRLLLRFTEQVEIGRTSVLIRDSRNRAIPLGPPTLRRLGPGTDTESPVTVVVALPHLPRGSYHVGWRTLSSDDLHETYGTIVFGVGARVAASGSGSAALGVTGLLEAALRWAGFAGLAVALGGLALTSFAVAAGQVRRWLHPVVHRGAVVALAACIAGAALTVARSGWDTSWHALGPQWTAQLLALAALVAASRSLRRPDPHATPSRRALRGGLAVLAGLSAVAATALSGHGVAAAGGRGSVLVAVHLVSTATWSGGVVLLAGMLLRQRYGSARASLDAAPLPLLLRRFAVVGVPGVVCSIVSGLLLAGLLVPSARALTDSGYGRTLLVKVALVLAAVALGGLTARSVRSASTGGTLRSHPMVVVEGVALLAALGGAALLSAQSPPTSLRWAPDAPPASSGVHTRTVHDLVVTATVAPNTPGPTFLTVGVLDTRRPAPAVVTGVDVVLARKGVRTTVPARPRPHQLWVAGSDSLDRAGPWRLTVIAHRAGYPDTVARFPWTLVPTPGTERGGPALRGTLDAAAWGLLGLSVLAGVVGLRRRGIRRRRPTPPDRPDVGVPPCPRPALPTEAGEADDREHRVAVGTT